MVDRDIVQVAACQITATNDEQTTIAVFSRFARLRNNMSTTVSLAADSQAALGGCRPRRSKYRRCRLRQRWNLTRVAVVASVLVGGSGVNVRRSETPHRCGRFWQPGRERVVWVVA